MIHIYLVNLKCDILFDLFHNAIDGKINYYNINFLSILMRIC